MATVNSIVTQQELEAAFRQMAVEPAQGGSASAAPLPGLISSNDGYNRYWVQLTALSDAGQTSDPIPDKQVLAVNLAEPADLPGTLEPGTPVLVWPSQGLYLFCQAVPDDSPPPSDSPSYWAKVVWGDGPSYLVRPQIADGADGFTDGPDEEDVPAANLWELTVDDEATASVPLDAVVRVWEEADSSGDTQRFFFYPIHAVYR